MLKRLLALIRKVVRAILGLHTKYAEGDVERDVFVKTSAALIVGARAQARTIATLATRGEIEAQSGEPLPLGPIVPTDEKSRTGQSATGETGQMSGFESEEQRLIAAMEKVLDDDDPTSEANRLARIAENEPMDAATAAQLEAMNTEHERIAGWRRVMDNDPCGKCVTWAENGKVFPLSEPMKRHTGDQCHMMPVLVDTRTGTELVPTEVYGA